MPALPGFKIFEQVTPATLALSPLVSPWFETSGYTNMLLSYVFVNSTGTTTLTMEGSFDGTAVDPDIVYAVPAPPQIGAGAVIAVLTTYVRFRIVQTTADATRTKIFAQARV